MPMKSYVVCLVCLIACGSRPVHAGKKGKKSLPEAAREAIKKAFPKAKIRSVEREREHGVLYYEVNMKDKDKRFEVEVSDTMDSYLDEEKMQALSLVVPCWTMGEIAPQQEAGLLKAVQSGVGLGGWHGGMCDAFRNNVTYQWMTGGQWVSHPGGIVNYDVNITNHDDAITKDIPDFKMRSEQYYMQVDPNNEVLATTRFDGVNVINTARKL